MDDDPQYLVIPLVTSTKGKSLLSIGDIDHQKHACQKHTAHQQRNAAATVLDSEMGDSSNADNSDMDGPTVSKNVKLGKSRVPQGKGKLVDKKQKSNKYKKKTRKWEESQEGLDTEQPKSMK